MLHYRSAALVLLLGLAGIAGAWAGRIGPEFQVNTYTKMEQIRQSVARLSDGGFVVTWESWGQDGPNGNVGVYGQRYRATGKRVGTEFRVNTTTKGQQIYPSVAGLAGGGFVVVWQSSGQDGSSFGISPNVTTPEGRLSAVSSE